MDVIIKEFPFTGDIEKLFTHQYKDKPYAFWLDGNRFIEGLSRYSFMGANPKFKVTIQEGCVVVHYPNNEYTLHGDPFSILQKILDDHAISNQVHSNIPFVGGFVGYFGYEMSKYVERVPTHAKKSYVAPEGCWMFYDYVLIVDHVEKKAYYSHIFFDDEVRNTSQIEKELEKDINQIIEVSLKKKNDIYFPNEQFSPLRFHQTETVSSYFKKIETIKRHIVCGDIYQACFTHAFSLKIQHDPYRLYQVLRRINPSPFSCYMNLNNVSILSTSPERFLQLNLEGELESRPIKGTRPRSGNKKVDSKLQMELEMSEKDRAENVMIVDLVRNDFGKVCRKVSVPKLMKVESYATVHQLVSVVHGKLAERFRPMDAIRAVFPGGSMTGAPKVRALEIIHSLEPVSRGIYSGGLGYLDVRGSFDLSMVIRTLISSKNQLSFHVGGGIVADSNPKEEYQESLDKAYALKKAIAVALSR